VHFIRALATTSSASTPAGSRIIPAATNIIWTRPELELPATYEKPGRAAQVNREMVHVQERLAELNPAWEAEAGKLSAMA
jgi:hypothetical protein